jgi:heme-degrading monooxygenase HmoA
MFIAVYRWTVKKGEEDRFVRAWHDGTLAITRRYGSFGSRMHREDGGDFIGYAQWPSRAAWQVAWSAHFDHDDKDAARIFTDAIAESHGPVLLMDVLDDLLIPDSAAKS